VLTERHSYAVKDGYLVPTCSLSLLGPAAPGRTPIEALIDSGATVSVFHRSAADSVGIELPRAHNYRIGYGGSTVPGWKQRVTLDMRGQRWTCDVVFVDRLAFPYSLLGRSGVFPRWKEVTFVEQQSPAFVEFRA
jgi:hypothetical protein